MRVTPDFSEAVDFGEQVPAGVYKARIDGFESKTSKTSNNPYIQWKAVLFGIEGELKRFNNRTVSFNTMTTGKGAGTLKSLLRATIGEPRPFDTTELVGKEVQLTLVDNRRDDGTMGWPEVKAIAPIKH